MGVMAEPTESSGEVGDRADDQLTGISNLGDTVRLALYRAAVVHRSGMSRDEAAAEVGISRSLAAYHLDKLAEAGLLDARFERRSGRQGPGAGRPAKVYEVSRRQFHVSIPPRDYELAAHLLADTLDSDADAPVRSALHHRSRVAGETLGAEARDRCSDDGIVGCVRQVLARRGYEPYDDHGVIRLRNCPFHTLAAQHRDLVCGMNLAVMEGMVDAIGADNLRPRLDPRTDECCVAFEPT